MGSVKIKAPAKGEKAWPAEQPTRRKVSDLVPYARNSRTHSDAQVAQIAASIREWGWTNPILIDETGGIIAGHGRVLAARKLKIEDVPCIIASGWSEAQKRAYILADNQLAINAGWDSEMLALELHDIADMGFDMDLIGFGNLDELLGPLDGDLTDIGGASLSERFGVAPFSVLNAREGWWQARKRAWLSVGIQSELGRGGRQVDDERDGSTPQALSGSGSKAERNGAVPGGGGKTAIYRKGPSFKYAK